MTVRVVPLGSLDASASRVGGTIAERVTLVGILSADQWALTHRPLPEYTRATMPVRVRTLTSSDD